MKQQVCLLPLFCLVLAAIVHAEEHGARVHMQEHLSRIDAIRSAILIGDLERVREPAIWLWDHEPLGELDLIYEPFVLSLRDHARDIATAADIDTAAQATARIAVDCGNCHGAAGVRPDFGQARDPERWPDMATHMQRHRWAVDRLWEGLIGPSDTSWSRGIRMLAEAPLLGTEAGWDEAETEGDALARRVHELGRDAASALTPEAKVTVYAKLISACAACHSRSDGGPRPD